MWWPIVKSITPYWLRLTSSHPRWVKPYARVRSTFCHKSDTKDSASYNIALTQPHFRLLNFSQLWGWLLHRQLAMTPLIWSQRTCIALLRVFSTVITTSTIRSTRLTMLLCESRIALNQFGSVDLATMPYVEYLNVGVTCYVPTSNPWWLILNLDFLQVILDRSIWDLNLALAYHEEWMYFLHLKEYLVSRVIVLLRSWSNHSSSCVLNESLRWVYSLYE
jgi:hypothetical protein